MNNILELKGNFISSSSNSYPGHRTMPTKNSINVNDMDKIIDKIKFVIDNWEGYNFLEKILVSVHYKSVIPKSSRIRRLFSEPTIDINKCIVGAKYSEGSPKHIITYYLSKDTLINSIEEIELAKTLLIEEYGEFVDSSTFNCEKTRDSINYFKYNIRISVFRNIIVDITNILNVSLPELEIGNNQENFIISFYKTEKKIVDILNTFGINITKSDTLDEHTVKLTGEQVQLLKSEVPYLLAMGVTDFSELEVVEYAGGEEVLASIHSPTNEPTIGVIDGLFYEDVYFSEWVDSTSLLSSEIPTNINRDYNHATMVSSIIVDGHRLNPELDDGCGHFRVRHFGVSLSTGFSSFFIVKKIREIVSNNKDIKVWNLSLGSNEEINKNFISAEAYELDKIQHENDCVFVISATNKRSNIEKQRIGSPADSINGLVVSSVDYNNEASNYSREGIVLSFFIKPDVSYYGGTSENKINVVGPFGKVGVTGTSYAAPWIARKLSYLIDILGISREIAKALIVDSAIGWNRLDYSEKMLMGHGVVPIKIDNIIKSPKDEIKFFFSGVSKEYQTYNYKFPIPLVNDHYPFVARATLAYFPKCSRNQGVDYTNTELTFRFGRIKDDGRIDTINYNKDNLDDFTLDYLTEDDSRRMMRKWDNVKHIREKKVNSPRARMSYSNKMWGLNIISSSRISFEGRDETRFGIVITLKEINGVNRIDDFIKYFTLSGWLVNKVDVESKLELYETLHDEITFD